MAGRLQYLQMKQYVFDKYISTNGSKLYAEKILLD